MHQKGFISIFLVLLIAIASLWLIGYFAIIKKQIKESSNSLTPSQPNSIASAPDGWSNYRNPEYNFVISYPSNYQALTDKESLYGWPNAIVLFYDGGQSYNLPIEVWNSELDYKSKYEKTIDWEYVKIYPMKNGKTLTLVNANKEPVVSEIISTFRFTN